MTAQLLTIDAATYHADLVDDQRPSLSASLIKVLLGQSPAHARVQHPRLNPDYLRVDEERFDLGTSVHQMFLEGIDAVAICPFDDWRTKAAKEARAEARAAGRIPMLLAQYEECEDMVEALREQCNDHPEGPFFTRGTAERTIVWTDEYDVLCRARLDWLTDDHTAVNDLKSTRASAHPDAWSRTALSIGADLQYAFYLRGCRAVFGVEPEFTFVVAETYPPYAVQPFSVAPDTLALAEKKISAALKLWAMCLRNNEWPAYSNHTAHITTPPYIEAAWLERELREVEAA